MLHSLKLWQHRSIKKSWVMQFRKTPGTSYFLEYIDIRPEPFSVLTSTGPSVAEKAPLTFTV